MQVISGVAQETTEASPLDLTLWSKWRTSSISCDSSCDSWHDHKFLSQKMHVKLACVKFSSSEKHWKTSSGLSLLCLLWRLPMLQAEIWQNLRLAQRLPTLVTHDGRVHVWMWLHSDHTNFCVLHIRIYIYTWCKSSRQLEKDWNILKLTSFKDPKLDFLQIPKWLVSVFDHDQWRGGDCSTSARDHWLY